MSRKTQTFGSMGVDWEARAAASPSGRARSRGRTGSAKADSSSGRPIFSRPVSLDHPQVVEENMCFALETFWPATDGWSAARIEEELVVTADGCEVITRFPAEELLVAGRRYWTVKGPLATTREVESRLNRNGRLSMPAGDLPARS